MTDRKYEFSWDLIGDLELGRPNLGKYCRLEVYRLMQFTFRDILEKKFGTEVANEIFYQAGYMSGVEVYKNLIGTIEDFPKFISTTQEVFKELGIGIMRVEKHDALTGAITITVSEDMDCSGLPELEYEICIYDEGFIAALLEQFTGKKYRVKEVDCWCTGDRTCRFVAELIMEQK
ncbi:MAG: 4-vinyl reductase [Bacillota bacterium]